MKNQVKLQEKAIDEIIERFGDTIDLKKSPYLIIEIVQQFQELLKGAKVAECLPPGGPPKRGDDVILLGDILREIAQLSASINLLHVKIDELRK